MVSLDADMRAEQQQGRGEAMRKLIARFWSDGRGSTATEYALIAIICSVAIIAGLYSTRDSVNKSLGQARDGLQSSTN